MAEFLPAYEAMILNEGGYKLHHVKGDTGGQTYAGISRKNWPRWSGWEYVDRGEIPPTALVRDFYKVNFWDAIRGDEIASPSVARCIFDFAVNAGPVISRKLSQVALQVTPDGIFGPSSMAALNMCDPEVFVLRFSLAKIARYRDIVTKNRSQAKFLLGWINRTLKEASV